MSTALTLERAANLEYGPMPEGEIEIVRCNSSHDEEWNQFVHACPGASFYHRAEWRAINEECFKHETVYLGAFTGGRMVGVFPMVRVKSLLFGNIACSMPFVNYGGPCGESDAIEQRLLHAGRAVADEWRADYLEIRSQRAFGEEYPCSDHKVSMTVDLDADPEVLHSRFKREHRKEIRRAYANGFVTKFGNDLVDDFYEVISDGWRELGTPIYKASYFKAVLRALPQSTRLCVVYAPDGRPAAGALDGLHRDVVEGMWLGIRGEYRRQLVGYVLYWELLKDACQQGFRRFHLGRSSKDSGGEQFKKKWNAGTLQLYWHYVLRTRTTIPDLNPSSAKYQLAIKTWRRLPVRMTQVLGPSIARCIP
jgi:FemAB-related protein (PEP-CTERM system-associated)